jgi:hypothetical protein
MCIVIKNIVLISFGGTLRPEQNSAPLAILVHIFKAIKKLLQCSLTSLLCMKNLSWPTYRIKDTLIEVDFT